MSKRPRTVVGVLNTLTEAHDASLLCSSKKVARAGVFVAGGD